MSSFQFHLNKLFFLFLLFFPSLVFGQDLKYNGIESNNTQEIRFQIYKSIIDEFWNDIGCITVSIPLSVYSYSPPQFGGTYRQLDTLPQSDSIMVSLLSQWYNEKNTGNDLYVNFLLPRSRNHREMVIKPLLNCNYIIEIYPPLFGWDIVDKNIPGVSNPNPQNFRRNKPFLFIPVRVNSDSFLLKFKILSDGNWILKKRKKLGIKP